MSTEERQKPIPIAYTLKSFAGGDDPEQWVWSTSEGKILSPIFTTRICAEKYQERMPMLTSDEWRELEEK